MNEHILQVLQARFDKSNPSWPENPDELYALLLTHGLLGFYQVSLEKSGDWADAPSEICSKVQVGGQAQWATNLRLAQLQDEACALFQKQGIACLVLKGLPLSERLYQNALVRPSGDVDILLSQKDFAKGVAALKEAGFVAQGRIDHFHLGMTSPKLPGLLELHCQLADRRFHFDPEAILQRTKMEIVSGKELRVMDPTDELLYLAYHHANHYLLYRFFWLMDVANFLLRYGEKIDWSAFEQRMKTWHIKRAVFASLSYAARFFSDQWDKKIKQQVRRLTLNKNKKMISFLADPKDPFHARVSRSLWARRTLGLLITDRMSDRMRTLLERIH